MPVVFQRRVTAFSVVVHAIRYVSIGCYSKTERSGRLVSEPVGMMRYDAVA